jgi:hypothetical protein
MIRYLIIASLLALLVAPVAARADESTIPPQMNWTPYPPMRVTVESSELLELLAKEGPITHQDLVRLIRSQMGAPGSPSWEMEQNSGVESTHQP